MVSLNSVDSACECGFLLLFGMVACYCIFDMVFCLDFVCLMFGFCCL